MHYPAHSAACQEKNDGLYQPGVGRQYHEPNETLWAKLKGLAYIAQARTVPLSATRDTAVLLMSSVPPRFST